MPGAGWICALPVEQDVLSAAQVRRYLDLLAPAECQVLASESFEEGALKSFAASEPSLEGSRDSAALASAVLRSLEPLAKLQGYMAEEFAKAGAMARILAIFRRPASAGAGGYGAGVTRKEFPGFARFCVAYRVHCYFGRGPQPPPLAAEVVFVVCAPGAESQSSKACSKIASTYGYTHVSAAKLLRRERKRGSSVEACYREGAPLPEDAVVNLLMLAMRGAPNGRYLLEGFPPWSIENPDAWSQVASAKVEVQFCLYLALSEPAMGLRLGQAGASEGDVERTIAAFRERSAPSLERLRGAGLLREAHAGGSTEDAWRAARGFFGPSAVFVLGGPGAGKGTLCARMAEAYGYTQHLSMGELLRQEIKRGGPGAAAIQECVQQGRLVPTATCLQLLLGAMHAAGWAGGRYLVDGFPRCRENLDEWSTATKGMVAVQGALLLEATQGAMEARVLQRSRTSGRADDNLENVRSQFMTFYADMKPVLEAFKRQNLLMKVDADEDFASVWRQAQGLMGPGAIFVGRGDAEVDAAQCARLSSAFGYRHLSAARLARGRELPPADLVRLLQDAMLAEGWEGGRFVLEGFPRQAGDLDAWASALGGGATVRHMLRFGPEALEDSLGATCVPAGADPEETFQRVQALLRPSVILLLGGPGTGKRTLGPMITEAFGFQRLSLDHLLREECARPWSEHGERIGHCFREGQDVPVEVALRLLKRGMEQRGWEGGRFVIDGFPRNLVDLDAWRGFFGSAVLLRCGLFLDCSEDLMCSRLLAASGGTASPTPDFDPVRTKVRIAVEECAPVAEQLEADGLLRKVDAEQEVEECWDCVNELLHLELDAHPYNHAVIIVKPYASSEATERFVRSFLASHGVGVRSTGTVPAAQAMAESGGKKSLFDRHHLDIVRNAEADPRGLQLTEAGRKAFAQAAGAGWEEAVEAGGVLSAVAAAAALGLDAKAFGEAWRAAPFLKLAPAVYVAQVSGSATAWVVNGFVDELRRTFASGADHLTWFCVEFSPERLSWRQFRSDILGETDPTRAKENSIRGQLHRHWQELALQAPPTTLNNCVHASNGPLEGLRECLLWTGMPLEDHAFGRSLLSAGVPRATLEAWLENPSVRDWGAAGSSGPLFACTEECEHAEVRQAAVQQVLQDGGRLELWQMSVKRPDQRRVWSRQVSRHSRQISEEKPAVLTLLHFNDVYNLEPRKKEPVGGIARFVTRMAELKAESVGRGEPEAMCFFSGDAFNPSLTSTFTQGRHMVPALNAVGIDVACFGNHDFDHGVDKLIRYADSSNFPWLISNVTDKVTGAPLAHGKLTHMVNWHGRKIGLMGLVEKEWLVTLHTIEPGDVLFEDFCQCGRRLAQQLRADGAELVIAMTHMRVPNDELLAHEVGEIDLILGGHDHHYEVKPVGPHGTYVLKSGTDFRDITELRLRFTGEPGPRAFEVLSTRHVEIDSSIAQDPAMQALVDECSGLVGGAMTTIIGRTAVDLDCRFSAIRTRETNIGNYITDVLRRRLKADIAAINSGTLRADAIIPAGHLTMKDLLSIIPMLDELCLLELSGADVLAILENGVSKYPRLEGRFLQLSGVSFTFDADAAPGARIVEGTALVGDQALDPQRHYKFCTLDYLRQGKDGFDALRGAMCLADGEQAGILPTVVQEHLGSIHALNGYDEAADEYRARRASKIMREDILVRVGEGPDPTKDWAIQPMVEGRIVCLNPAPDAPDAN